MDNSENKEGKNLEEINKKKVLNFGNLSYRQSNGIGFYKLDVGWDEALVKCERCNEQMKAKWRDNEWNMEDGWKVYLRKAQIEKDRRGYYIDGVIQFYCSDCDWKHNHWEKG